MPEPSTTVVDNPSDDAASSTTVTDPATTTDNGTAKTDDNPDASKSDDTTVVTDDDKSKDTKTTDKTDDAPTSTKLDDDLDDWITKRGLKVPETEAEKVALQELRNDQREFTKSRQADAASKAVKELGDEIHKSKPADDSDDDDELDPSEKRIKALEEANKYERETRIQSDFYRENGITADSAEHKAILDIFREETSKGETVDEKKADIDYWSNPKRLPLLLQLAKARINDGVDTNAIAEKAAKEERERIARESESKSPSRSATTTDLSNKTPDQERTERLKARYSTNKS
jgi:hypothetical protein